MSLSQEICVLIFVVIWFSLFTVDRDINWYLRFVRIYYTKLWRSLWKMF